MKRRLFYFLIIFLLWPLNLWAACSGSSPTWTTTPDWSSVNTCISGASAGDTINVTAGDGAEQWGTVTLTKEIHLIGPGKDNLIITGSSNPMIHFMPSSCIDGGPEIEVSGFTFNCGNNKTIIQLWDDNTSTNPLCTKANIHENLFTGKTSSGSDYWYIAFYGMGGVVWKNTFTGHWQYFVGIQQGTVDSFAGYDTDLNTEKALYFEDNILNKVGTGDDMYIHDCQFGGLRTVFRYNTWNIPGSETLQCLIDWHGWVNNNYVSCQGYLLYGNQFNMTNNGGANMVCNRGGKSVHYFNNFTTTDSATMGDVWSESATGTGCPTTYTDHQIHQDYQWNNRRNLTGTVNDWSQNDTCTCDGVNDYPRPDHNYFDYVYSGYNGTTGTGCGTLANRPVSPSLNRTGYWATNGTCSTVSGYTGDIVTYPTRENIPDGTLYVYEDGSWSTWYTPYTYPHPLREEGTTPPSVTECTIQGVTPGQHQCAEGYWPVTPVTMACTTDIAATCKYDTSDVAYASMANTFSTTGTTSHSQSITVNCGSNYTYYVRCIDGGLPMTTSYPVSFSVDKDPPPRRTYHISYLGDEWKSLL